MSWLSRRPPVAESEVEPPAETPETADRLRRIVARQQAPEPAAEKRTGAPTAHDRTDWTMPSPRLGITLDATGERISQAFDDLSFEPGQDPGEARCRPRAPDVGARPARAGTWLAARISVEITGQGQCCRSAAGDITAHRRHTRFGLRPCPAQPQHDARRRAADRPPGDDLGARRRPAVECRHHARPDRRSPAARRVQAGRPRSMGPRGRGPPRRDRHRARALLRRLAGRPHRADQRDATPPPASDGRSTLFLEKVAAAHAANIDRRLEQLNERISTYVDKLRETAVRPGRSPRPPVVVARHVVAASPPDPDPGGGARAGRSVLGGDPAGASASWRSTSPTIASSSTSRFASPARSSPVSRRCRT